MKIAVIPARGGSKRIPRKNIVDFFGKPMLGRTIEALRACGHFDEVHVSTDDDEIAGIARAFGADACLRRPAELADDHAPVLPVLRWVLARLREQGREFNAAMLAMPCAPLLEAADYARACEEFDRHGGRLPVLSVCRYPAPPEWAFRPSPTGSLIADPAQLLMRSQDLAPAYFDCGLFSVFAPTEILGGTQLVAHEFIGCELQRWQAIDIDQPADLEDARQSYLVRRGQ